VERFHYRKEVQAAGHMKTNVTSLQTSITKEAINHLPLHRFNGPIRFISNTKEAKEAVALLKKERILGLDTETKPTFRKGEFFPPALLQLAGEQTVYLFQLRGLNGLESIVPLLSDPKIIKAGVAIHDDIRKLVELDAFKPAGIVEISDITKKLGIINTGLRSLAAIFLKCRISKGAQITNWNRKQLSETQIKYAATDAWISRELYICISKVGNTKRKPAPTVKPKIRVEAPADTMSLSKS
jgi:ribonuclease D